MAQHEEESDSIRPDEAEPAPTADVRKRKLFRFVAIISGCLFGLGMMPIVFQEKMIYFPARYSSDERPGEGRYESFVTYETADGRRQWGYLIEPADDAPSPAFYFVFYGNASTAMQMVSVFEKLAAATGCGFFIPDYRGYGFNKGRPSEKGLTADAIGAYDTMKAAGRLDRGAGAIGHSLGGGVTFALAESRPLDRLITLSTFTSIEAMAKRVAPGPSHRFLRSHFPNDRRLAELLGRPPGKRPAEIHLFHATNDRTIPFEMGETLAATPGEGLTFKALPEATHDNVVNQAFDDLVGILKAGPARERSD